jgi:hypothetical protein
MDPLKESSVATEIVEAMLARCDLLEEILWESHSLQAIRLGTIVEEGLRSLQEELRRSTELPPGLPSTEKDLG